jgi:hypothetical protein
MDIYQSIARRYKKGKSYQWNVPLYKGHPFNDREEVAIVQLEDLEDLEETLKKLVVAKEVIGHYQKVKSTQETIIAIYRNRGTWGRLRNKEPAEIKDLEEDIRTLVQVEEKTSLILGETEK